MILARSVHEDGTLDISDAFEDTRTCKQFEAGGRLTPGPFLLKLSSSSVEPEEIRGA